MRFLLLSLGFLALSASSGAQVVDTKRVDEIWSIAQDRMVRQNDIWFDGGDYPRIIQCLRFQHAIFPSDYDVATNLGWMLENVEEWDMALAVYIEYRNQNPNDPDAPYPEAYFYFSKRAYDKIPPLLEPTLNKKPHPDPNTFRTLAHAYERLNLYTDAQRVWKAYLALAPNDAAAKANLAKVERKLKGG
jgi:tetratricopeptide (TPR) repeat protein